MRRYIRIKTLCLCRKQAIYIYLNGILYLYKYVYCFCAGFSVNSTWYSTYLLLLTQLKYPSTKKMHSRMPIETIYIYSFATGSIKISGFWFGCRQGIRAHQQYRTETWYTRDGMPKRMRYNFIMSKIEAAKRSGALPT